MNFSKSQFKLFFSGEKGIELCKFKKKKVNIWVLILKLMKKLNKFSEMLKCIVEREQQMLHSRFFGLF